MVAVAEELDISRRIDMRFDGLLSVLLSLLADWVFIGMSPLPRRVTSAT